MTDHLNRFVEFVRTPDWLKSVIDHHRYTFVAALLIGAMVGCASWQSKTPSPVNGKPVTRAVLDAEVVAMQAHFKAAYADLDSQDSVKIAVFDTLNSILGSMPTPWTGLALSGLSMISAGLLGDVHRKNKKIAVMEDETPEIKVG